MRRVILGAILFLSAGLIATQIFLHQTSVGSSKFVRMTFILWTATVLVVLALLILATVLGRNLIKLYFERKSGLVGSRFKTKMVSTFVALSFLPALLLFLLAYGLINISIEQWFSAPATQLLEKSREIALQYYDENRRQALRFAANIASSIAPSELQAPEGRARLEQRLAEAGRNYDFDNVRVFNEHGELAVETGKRASREDHRALVKDLVARALRGQGDFHIERVTPKDALTEVAWATAPIRDQRARISGAVLAEMLISESANFKAYSVMEAYNAYEQLQSRKGALRFNFLLILALSTLLIVFAFSWFAMYLAKRITVPIQALAEGAAAVAGGNLDYRVKCEAFDELGSLVVSFNRMTGELQENKRHIEATQNSLRQTNVELDDRRRYIETIVQTIATGVISLDVNHRIRTMNRAAMQMLEVQGFVPEVPLDQVVRDPASDTLRMLLHKSAVLGPVVRNIELNVAGKTLHLATTVTPLVDSSGQRTGWVMVLDDVTELLRIEKMAAWQEVARRLAHEIKNPLTPIQLSAERILRRYQQIAAIRPSPGSSWQEEFAAFDNLLEECVRTITQEADSLKNLVDEFSRFARLPEVQMRDSDLHGILDNTLSLYDGRIQDVRVVKNYASNLPLLRLDPDQIKRVFINLLDNALEAMAENTHAKVLQIRTCLNKPQNSVRIELSDTGRGFPREYRDSLFLPYFSTRNGGTGLGLAIVRQIIADHRGYVRAEPNSPLGTRIVIDLPLAQA